MARITIVIRHIAWRDGRPRFVPGPGLRRLGYKGEDLKRANGEWMTAEEARTWMEGKLAEIENRKSAKAAGRRLAPLKRAAVYTVEQMFEDWLKTDKMRGKEVVTGKRRAKPLSQYTVRDYRNKTKNFGTSAPEVYGAAAAALDKPIIWGLYEALYEERGVSMARGMIAVLSSALGWAIKTGRVALPYNPCDGLNMAMPTPRLRAATIKEITQLVTAADAIGRHDVGDAIMLGVWSGQRQVDRLSLMDGGRDDQGRLVFRQSKTGAMVAMLEAPPLVSRLTAAKERRKKANLASTLVLMDEAAGMHWTGDRYRKAFALVRHIATSGLSDKSGAVILAPMASLDDFRDQDLRDTAVTWLARAGCTISQIRSITGHADGSIYSILKHYLAVDGAMADEAIGRLVAWHAEQEQRAIGNS